MKIIKPSDAVINGYLKKWDSLENYVLQESSLKKLFRLQKYIGRISKILWA